MAQVTLYWRPGCPFCGMLVHSLQQAGIEYSERNIWEDPEAAAFVRSVANGNETVPTVTVGEKAMVNPRIEEVVAAMSGA